MSESEERNCKKETVLAIKYEDFIVLPLLFGCLTEINATSTITRLIFFLYFSLSLSLFLFIYFYFNAHVISYIFLLVKSIWLELTFIFLMFLLKFIILSSIFLNSVFIIYILICTYINVSTINLVYVIKQEMQSRFEVVFWSQMRL